jgi:hypothetical protein
VDNAGTRESTLEKCHFSITTSPQSARLRLLCTPKTRARDTLDIRPPLPLIVQDSYRVSNHSRVENIIAKHNDRVRHTRDRGQYFPIRSWAESHYVCDHFYLFNVPFPGLPKLLLSAIHLVYLDLLYIPHSGYISPEAMATSFSALTNLASLHLQFRYPRPHPAPGSRRLLLPPLTRSILPSLTEIKFKGASEYLEEILARIDASRLNRLHITFFNQIIFDTPQLFQFISRRPTLRAPEEGDITFNSEAITVEFLSQKSNHDVLLRVENAIHCVRMAAFPLFLSWTFPSR